MHIRYFKFEDGEFFLYFSADVITPCNSSNAINFFVSEYISNYRQTEDGILKLSRKMANEITPIMPSEFSSLALYTIEKFQEKENHGDIYQLFGNLNPLTLITR